MNTKLIKKFVLFSFLILILAGCASSQSGKSKPFKHDTPLIKDDIRKMGKLEVDKTVEMGPKPTIGDTTKLEKRKKISSQTTRNYLLIPEEYLLLKQSVTLNFKNLDYAEALNLMGKIGDINVLVGEEVAGAISAELVDVPWDKAFNALLDLKNFAADFDVASNLIRVHSPANLTQSTLLC